MGGPDDGNQPLPPTDSGGAGGPPPSRTTITFGAGPSFFDGRLGLAGKKPGALQDLPAFGGDELRSEWCGGDLGGRVGATEMQIGS
ncbi:Dyp-type peroxidase domain-containing protein, partial [Paenibacillus sp. GbtcB18]|uniref:Dyp-type peroxidase domain-containing protein n=1 Tax=Paenibacillus sp. GbtcB18 TaxID=2824763 RepID=UPI0020C7415B